MWLTPDLGGHQPFFFFCLIDQDQLQFTQKVESTLPQNKEENFLAGPGCLLMKTFRKDSDKTVSGVCKWRHTGKTEVQLKNVIFCAVLPISDQSRKEDGAVDFLCLSGQTSQHILQQTALALPPWADLQLPRLSFPPLYCTCFALLEGKCRHMYSQRLLQRLITFSNWAFKNSFSNNQD